MANTFGDLVVSMGRPWRWYRLHGATAGSDVDSGSQAQLGDASNISGESGTLTEQQTGPHTDDTTNYSLQFTDGWLDREPWSTDDFNGTANGSVVLFFKTAGTGAYQFLLGTHPTGAGSLFAFYVSDVGAVRFQVTSSGSNSRIWDTPSSSYDDNAWHMLAVVCDGTNANRMFMDGEEVSPSVSTAGSSPPGTAAWLGSQTTGPSNWSFRIGNDPRAPGSSDLPFVGCMAEVMLWEQPLSATEIYDLWTASQGAPPPPPAGAGGHRYRNRRTFAGF